MIELHLFGYTADLGRLVLDLAGTDGGRYRVVVDEDLFATVDELRERRRAAGLPVGDLVEFADELGLAPEHLERVQRADTAAAVAAGQVSAGHAAAADVRGAIDQEPVDDRPVAARWDVEDGGLIARLLDEHRAATASTEPEPEPESGPEPDHEPEPGPEPELVPPPTSSATDAAESIVVPPRPDAHTRQPPRLLEPDPVVATEPATSVPASDSAPVAETPRPALSPAEIQARLRHGKSVRVVAREAGVDEAWIRRWEAPILAEQARVREQALAARLRRPRLGSSSQPLGDAVAHNLGRRRVDPGEVTWEVSRRRDGRWRVVVRYPYRGSKRSATWTYDPEEHTITAASDGARELGFTRRR